ncbi:DUF1614 domain-containing protein [Ammonifex thiophilus]|uniref:DUF1614 domain-containing protein n=1 Tax=Ammonifex thiophilus TaxID=444093 RepID=UPI001403C938|nr:DUF1614 domain-containing protein [Ammonifex thiophilus]
MWLTVGCAFPLILLLLIPLLFFLFYFQLATFSFTKLGLSPETAILFFGLCLIGGMVNIPISRQRIVVEEGSFFGFPFFFYYPPRVREQVIALNLGGAILPGLFSLYLLFTRAPLVPSLIATALVTVVAYALARPVPGMGITLPAFVPPLVAAAAAWLVARENAAPVAYVAGVWGTLIGADLLNWPRFKDLGALVLSIGGAGIFDGIFLVGIVAALLA